MASHASTLGTTRPATAPPADRAARRALLLGAYRTMFLSRRLDDTEIDLRKRNEVFFQISGAGHEALNVALAHVLRAGHDWFFPYYRDRALMLGLGMSAADVLLSAVGAADDPNSHGYQMPCHWGWREGHVVSQSSPTGSQFLQAVGCAQGGRYIHDRALDLPAAGDEVVHVSSGDGTTNQGDFHEALSQACIDRLPVLFVIENNHYAISVPIERHTPAADIAAMVAGYEPLEIVRLDGNDFLGCLETLGDLVARMRRRETGPVLVDALVTRPYSHSLSDDHAFYRTKEELEEEAAHDCLRVTRRRALDDGIASEDDFAAVEADVEEELREAVERALAAAKPDPAHVMDHLTARTNSPADRDLYGTTPPAADGEPLSMGQAINRTLHLEMEHDPRMRVWGQDVADASREQALRACKGKGGVFKITHGLQAAFGYDRAYNAPLAESKIIGTAIGQAVRGLKPVVEVQFFDYIWTAMNQIRNEMATMRYRSGGDWACPMVARVPIGGYLRGGSIYHSQTGENIFAHCPGLRVAYPSNALDAAGLLRTAIRCDDPVLFLEHKHLYYQGHNRDPYPGADFTIPFGVARVRRTGDALTVVTWGALVQRSLEAADRLARERGVEAEVIDLRTIAPLDEETIFASVRKTGKAIIVAEENVSSGFGGEVAARIVDECFEWLDAPVRRCGSLDTWVGYAPVLEAAILPQTDDVVAALEELAAY